MTCRFFGVKLKITYGSVECSKPLLKKPNSSKARPILVRQRVASSVRCIPNSSIVTNGEDTCSHSVRTAYVSIYAASAFSIEFH